MAMYRVFPSATSNALCVPNPDLLHADWLCEDPGRAVYEALSGAGLPDFDITVLKRRARVGRRPLPVPVPLARVDRIERRVETLTMGGKENAVGHFSRRVENGLGGGERTGARPRGARVPLMEMARKAMTEKEAKEARRARQLLGEGKLIGTSGVKILITEAN